MDPKDLPPQKRQAYELLLRKRERLAERYHQSVDEQWEIMREIEEDNELWRMAGFGEPPEFRPTRPLPTHKVGAA